MKNILSTLLLLALVVGFSQCTSAPATDQAQSETPAAEPEEATTENTEEAEPMAAGQGFTTTVLKDGIASPRKEMKGNIGTAEIAIQYGSPSVKGRTIWGDLVPFDEVWRTGANEATIFTTTSDINIEGQKLAAGTYGLFTIPKEEGVVLIFNETAEQWGAYDYDEAKDVLRIEVKPNATEELAETMDFVIEGDVVVLMWENWKIPFSVSAT